MTASQFVSDRPRRVVGVVRVSTDEQSANGSVPEQTLMIRRACEARGWELVDIYEDIGESGATLRRPGVQAALRLIADGAADVLMASRLDRLTRSVGDFTTLLDRANKYGWAVVVLDVGLDTSTPFGELAANIMASFAQYERRLISQRTKEGLARKRAAGVVLGRPRLLPVEVVDRIRAEREAGRSLRQIAEGLNADGVATAQGGAAWHGSTVRAVLRYSEHVQPSGQQEHDRFR